MSPTKEIFNKDKELRERWVAVSASDWFKQVLMYAKSEFCEHSITEQELAGAKRFEKILLTITDQDYVPPEPIKSPLNHGIDNPLPESRKPQAKKEK